MLPARMTARHIMKHLPITDAATAFMPRTMACGFGMPHDRAARVAARRAFVAMKRVFLDAAILLEGSSGACLRRRVRLALQPSELLSLQATLIDGLPVNDERSRHHRHALYRQLEELIPETALTGFVPLSPAR
jgi:hypothetical protein